MRFLMIGLVLLASSPALAEVVTGTKPATEPSAVKVREAAVADCVAMWDRGTHMSKQEWLTTCRRVQDRLQSMQGK